MTISELQEIAALERQVKALKQRLRDEGIETEQTDEEWPKDRIDCEDVLYDYKDQTKLEKEHLKFIDNHEIWERKENS